MPCGNGSRPASKLLISLSTNADSSDDQRPVRHVLFMADLLTAALFLSDGEESTKDVDLAFGDSSHCSRDRNAFSNAAAGSGSNDMDMAGVWHDGHMISLFMHALWK